jgi:amino acid transporter
MSFERKASGLARGISPLDSFILGTSYAGIAVMSMYLAWGYDWTPGAMVALATLIATVLSAVGCLSYGFLATSMPRSGGEYVFLSRIIHPAIGFAANWSTVVWLAFYVAWHAHLFPTVAIPMALGSISRIVNIPWLLGVAEALTIGPYYQWYTMLIGTILIVGIALLLILPVKIYFWYQKICFALIILGTIVSIAIPFLISQTSFAASFNEFSAPYTAEANSYQYIIDTARDQGFNPSASGGLGATFLVLPLIWWAVSWGFATTYLAGETKNVKLSNLLAVPGGVVILGVVYALWDISMSNGFGYEFTRAISYLYANAPEMLPVAVPPYAYFLASIASGVPYLVILLSISFALNNLMNVNAILATRCVHAWGMDRIMPSFVSKVNDRFHTPHWAVILISFVGWIWLWIYTFTPQIVTFTGALGLLVAILVVQLACMIFPYVKKDIFEASPVNWRLGGIPVMSIVGFVGFVWMAYITLIQLIDPAYAANDPISLTAIVLVIVLGFVVYYVAKYIRRKQGIDLDLLYKEVPPV